MGVGHHGEISSIKIKAYDNFLLSLV